MLPRAIPRAALSSTAMIGSGWPRPYSAGSISACAARGGAHRLQGWPCWHWQWPLPASAALSVKPACAGGTLARMICSAPDVIPRSAVTALHAPNTPMGCRVEALPCSDSNITDFDRSTTLYSGQRRLRFTTVPPGYCSMWLPKLPIVAPKRRPSIPAEGLERCALAKARQPGLASPPSTWAPRSP